MAEPSAGLLSPRSVARFSSPYVNRVVEAVAEDHFAFVLHNCAAKLAHLSAIPEAGAKIIHFGAPMDLPTALAKVPKDIARSRVTETSIWKAGSLKQPRAQNGA